MPLTTSFLLPSHSHCPSSVTGPPESRIPNPALLNQQIPDPVHNYNPECCSRFSLNSESRTSNKPNPGSRKTYWGPFFVFVFSSEFWLQVTSEWPVEQEGRTKNRKDIRLPFEVTFCEPLAPTDVFRPPNFSPGGSCSRLLQALWWFHKIKGLLRNIL